MTTNVIQATQQSLVAQGVRGMCAVLLGVSLLLSGCSTVGNSEAEPAPPIRSLEAWMSQAEQAVKEGQRERSRESYRAAAQAYPTAKEPWQKLAEDYFNAGDYGNAVLAGQEVLQRDPQDNLTHSILAVSGLRITAGSLKALRKEAGYPVGSRDEALALTRALRDALGEQTLLTDTPNVRPAPKRTAPSPGAASSRRRSKSAEPAVTLPPVPAGNPLDKLK